MPVTRLKRRSRTAQSNCVQGYVTHFPESRHSLLLGNWNVILFKKKKELELVEEAKKYHRNIIGVSSTKRRSSGIANLYGGLKLFYSGADRKMSFQAGVIILTSPQLSDSVFD